MFVQDKVLNKLWTDEEKTAIDYVEGAGVYKYYRSLKKPPNILDTRESLLLKMHDPKMRDKFLDTLAQRVKNESTVEK